LGLASACATHSSVPIGSLLERAAKEEAALLKRVKVYDDPQLGEYVKGIAARVTTGAKVTVIQDPTLGAFALPGGRVFVHTGLLSAIESEAQLALILGREAAHDPSRLEPRRSKGPMSTVALGPTAAALLSLDLRLTASAAIEGYGPEGERAADAEAFARLRAAGYDPREAAGVFPILAASDADRLELAEMFVYGSRERMTERGEVWRELLGEGRRAARTGGDTAPGASQFARRMRSVVRDNAALDVRAERFALAQRQLDRAIALDSDDAIAQLRYGELHRLQSQRLEDPERAASAQRAIERYRRAAELDPLYAEPFRQLALLHYQGGDLAHAREALERYLALAGDGPEARRIREYLAILGQ
jgi:beta-barrel assembly-enhancing protease